MNSQSKFLPARGLKSPLLREGKLVDNDEQTNRTKWIQLFLVLRMRIFRCALGWASGDEAKAWDVVNDTYIKLTKCRHPISLVDHPESFIFKIARNVFYTICRRQAGPKLIASLDDPDFRQEAEPQLAIEPDIQSKLESKEIIELLAPSPESLADRHLFELMLGGHSLEEMASILGTSTGSVKKQQARLKYQIKRKIEKLHRPLRKVS